MTPASQLVTGNAMAAASEIFSKGSKRWIQLSQAASEWGRNLNEATAVGAVVSVVDAVRARGRWHRKGHAVQPCKHHPNTIQDLTNPTGITANKSSRFSGASLATLHRVDSILQTPPTQVRAKAHLVAPNHHRNNDNWNPNRKQKINEDQISRYAPILQTTTQSTHQASIMVKLGLKKNCGNYRNFSHFWRWQL